MKSTIPRPILFSSFIDRAPPPRGAASTKQALPGSACLAITDSRGYFASAWTRLYRSMSQSFVRLFAL